MIYLSSLLKSTLVTLLLCPINGFLCSFLQFFKSAYDKLAKFSFAFENLTFYKFECSKFA